MTERSNIDPCNSPSFLLKDENPPNMTTIHQVTVISTENVIETNNDKVPKSKLGQIRYQILGVLDSHLTTLFMTMLTIYALFGQDIKILGFPKSYDNAFNSLTIICLLFYSLEILLTVLCRPEYRWSFYFWLDLISTLTLVLDLSWLWDSALGLNSDTSSSNSGLQNAADSSKAGKKTSQALNIVRLVRLVRIVKLYKTALKTMNKVNKRKVVDEEAIQEEAMKESNIGKKLSELTMKRVIVIVLSIIFILPFFQTSFYYSSQTSWDFGTTELNTFSNEPGFETVLNQYTTYHLKDVREVIYLSYTNYTGFFSPNIPNINYTSLRFNEMYFAQSGSFISITDIRYDTQLSALLGICRTIYVCIVLTAGAIYFSKDAQNLVVAPIEKMLANVKIIAKNPLAASEVEVNKANDENENKCCMMCRHADPNADYETRLLETTIVKIGVLLALSFGEAGSEIIGSNVENGGELDPMSTGSKVVGIFGFCDIRNFTDTTEELQEGVMMFVNEIAEVVHGIVDKYLGAANKNIGDAFLLVWKFGYDDFFLEENSVIRNPNSIKAHYLPDLSLLSFLKILAKVNKDQNILKYRTNQKLIARMPNYEVKMGFGMHIGWAIEGAIGSQFKIDASYLSPNVNVASALEGSTKIYGVPLLISGPLFDFFSDPIKKYCRQIDTVMIKGNSVPVKLYTSDCDFSEFTPTQNNDRSKKFFRQKKKTLKRLLEKQETTTEEVFMRSQELQLMRKPFTEDFYKVFDSGVKDYIEGSWFSAKIELEKALNLKNKDGPSLSLINFMSEYAFRAPLDWKGFRSLG